MLGRLGKGRDALVLGMPVDFCDERHYRCRCIAIVDIFQLIHALNIISHGRILLRLHLHLFS